MTIDEKAWSAAVAAMWEWHVENNSSCKYSSEGLRAAIEAYLSALPPSPATAEGCRSSGDHDWSMSMTRGHLTETICRNCYAAGIVVVRPATPAQEG